MSGKIPSNISAAKFSANDINNAIMTPIYNKFKYITLLYGLIVNKFLFIVYVKMQDDMFWLAIPRKI